MACEQCGGETAGRLCGGCFRVVNAPAPTKKAKAPARVSTLRRTSIEAQLERITATRKARERVLGRKYTITSGWQQRPGVNAFDRGCGLGYR